MPDGQETGPHPDNVAKTTEDLRAQINDLGEKAKKMMPPSPFPPMPDPLPGMVIEFQFCLNQTVIVQNLNIYGNISAAAVVFDDAIAIYLVDDAKGNRRWYPETMLNPVPMYFGDAEK